MKQAPRETRNVSTFFAPLRSLPSVAAVFGVMLLLTAAPAFAQEAATESPVGRTFRWLNFAIVFALLAYVIVKYGAPSFRNRASQISEKIAEGARAREAAEAQRREIQAKVANLQSEIEQLRRQGRRDAADEAQRLRDTVRSESET